MVPKQEKQSGLQLSAAIIGLVDVRHLQRELEGLEEFVRQSEIREPGKQAALPRIGRLLQAVATDNGLQLLQPSDRQKLASFLESVEKDAPRIHMSFAIESNMQASTKITGWLRANIHPLTLLEIGLQPSIAAGTVVRTNNKVFDFSLRHRFAEAQALLVASLEKFEAEAGQQVVAEVAAVPAQEPVGGGVAA